MGDETAWLPCQSQSLLALESYRLFGGESINKKAVVDFLVTHPSLLIAAVQSIEENNSARVSTVRTWFDNESSKSDLTEVMPAHRRLKGQKAFWNRLSRLKTPRCFAKAVKELFEAQKGIHGQPRIRKKRISDLSEGLIQSIRRAAKRCLKSGAWVHPNLSFPRLLELIQQSQKMQRDFDAELMRQKLDSMRLLAYGASHEINNPLANVATRAQSLLQGETNPKRHHRLTVIYEQAMRAHEMISDMMLFAHPPAVEMRQLDLMELSQKVVDELSSKLSDEKIDCVITGPSTQWMMGDATKLAAALKALLANAIEAIGCEGRIEVDVELHRGQVRWTVSDDGPGVDEQISENIFDPFFSGREAGRGLGFGLSKAWRIVQMHDANIQRSVSELGGAKFAICFPAVSTRQLIDLGPDSVAA